MTSHSMSKRAYGAFKAVLEAGVHGVLPPLARHCWIEQDKFYRADFGREHANGAITGTIFNAHTGLRAGYFRIDPDGYVRRWPHANEAMKTKIHELNKEDKVVVRVGL